MKLGRYATAEGPRVVAVLDDQVLDLERACPELASGGSMRSLLAAGKEALDAARQAAATPDPRWLLPLEADRLLAPIRDPQKIVCVGQNYRDHCEEQGQPLPDRAILFAKFASAIQDPGKPIELPPLSSQVDYEAELAFVIGRRARRVSEEEASRYVAGYMCLNDVSARDIQFADKQWVRGKTFDTFAPIGPWIVTADEIADPHTLPIQLTLNGTVMQRSNTCNLIFGVYYLVSYISQVATLEPGDIVTTGTPGGVGVFRNPQVFLKPGDEVCVEIEGIGRLVNPVVAS